MRNHGLRAAEGHSGTKVFSLRENDATSLTFFVQNLKDFVETVKLVPEVHKGLKGIVSHFAFILTIFKKYEDTLNACGIEGTLADKVKAMGWLLYIMARAVILKGRDEIVESACLLIVVLTVVIVNRPESVAFSKVPDGDSKAVKRFLCDMFKLKSQEAVDALMDSFVNHLQILSSGVLKGDELKENSVDGCNKLFHRDSLELNILKLNAAYQQTAALDGIDDRSFIASETRIRTPVKLTPFARQGEANRLATPRRAKDMEECDLARRDLGPCKKILTYSGRVRVDSRVTLNTNFQEIKFSKYAASPCPTAQFTAATPITRAMEINNWLLDHIRKVRLGTDGLTPELSRMFEKAGETATNIRRKMDENIERIGKALGYEHHTNQIRCMHYRILEELLLAEERGRKDANLSTVLQTESFHKGVLVAATETTLFVHNSVSLMFEEILDLVQLSAFDFWKLLPSFLRFDTAMPAPLVHHFSEIECKILELLAWEKRSPIYDLISQITARKDQPREENKEKPQHVSEAVPESQFKYAHERFFKKVLQLVATHIEEITSALDLRNELIKERIWDAAKLLLSTETDLLIGRHIDQLVLCGVYAICRMEQSKKPPACPNYSFNNIVSCYIQLNERRGKVTSALFQSVKISDTQSGDIIEFYNKVYVPKMKGALCKLCAEPATQPGGSLKELTSRARIKMLAPPSPLKESLGDQARQGAFHRGAMTPSKFAPTSPLLARGGATPMMTPRTRKLFACPESPAPRIHPPAAAGEQPRRASYKTVLMDQLLKQSKAVKKRHVGKPAEHPATVQSRPAAADVPAAV